MKHHRNIKQTIKRIYERRTRLDYIKSLYLKAREHELFQVAQEAVDRLFDRDYESGTIVGISPNREGFDDLHENYTDMYRGGFEETKIGDNYIIYGFDFD
jgi:hypothetical protein